MPFQILSLNFMTTFIITFNNLPKTSLIMCLQIFMNYLSLTSIILAMNLSKWTIIFMQLNVSSLQLYSAAFFEKTFSFVWTLNNFQNATLIYVLNHFSSLNALPTIIFALDFKVLTKIFYMFINLIQWHLFSTI